MKLHTSDFKNNVKKMGRQLSSIITYGNTTLEDELYAVTPHYNANLLKSVMKQLDIESSVDIPIDTIINYKLGIKVNNSFEYLDFGNYVVYSSEKQEDTNTFKIVCYDKMLYAMKQNEDLGITYPITIKNYLTALATKIGLTVKSGTFINENMQIPGELYAGLNYTYRDILDQIAEATGSNIVINKDDQLEVRYFTTSGDTIDEEFLKDVNVNFGEKYGPINSIVLSRSASSDNIYIKDDESIEENGLCEIKISDNQIMNFNDRSQYLPGLLEVLGGFYYYLNDFTSTGICYYDVCDLYNIVIGENIYRCAMLNDEINVTMGLEELIHTDRPEQSETDYSKADKTDRRINETYLIVDKQNQQIEAVINNVTEQNAKISQVTQTVDELNAKIQENMDFTTSGESTLASVSLDSVEESYPITIKVHPIIENISYLYPNTGLFPSASTYLKNRIIRFIRTYEEDGETKTQNIDYELPDDLLYYNSSEYDEFYYDITNETCEITKKCKYNADGTVVLLAEPVVNTYTFPQITLGAGDYEIKLLGYNTGYIFVRAITENSYTSQFATKAELASSITQTKDEINLSVDGKLTEYSTTQEINAQLSLKIGKNENDQIISMINASADTISLSAGRLLITSGNFQLDSNGTITVKNAKLNGVLQNYATSTGYKSVQISNSMLSLYDWGKDGHWVGNLSSVYSSSTGISGIAFTGHLGDYIYIGYKDYESDTPVHPLMSFNTSDSSSVPYIKNTISTTLFSEAGGITIKNGLVVDSNLTTVSGTLFSNAGGGITVKNGLITGWSLSGSTGTLFGTLDGGGITVKNGLITSWGMSPTFTGSFPVWLGGDNYLQVTVRSGLIADVTET